MTKLLKWLCSLLAIVALGSVLIWAFLEKREERGKEAERERPVEAPSRVSVEHGESVVKLDQDTQTKSGIRSAALPLVSRREETRVHGTVLPLQDLLDLRNNYATAQARLEKAQAGLEVSRKEYQRLKGLFDDHQNTSAKAVESAEGLMRSDETEVRAARQALPLLEGNVRQLWGPVLADEVVHASQEFNRLLRQEDVLIHITLPPSLHMAAPRTARVQAPGSSETASAELVSAFPRVDPRVQGIGYLYRAAARPWLAPGANLIALLPAGRLLKGVIVPDTATVWWQGKAWCYVQAGPERFIRRELSAEMPAAGGWFATAGFSPGDKVVTSGAQLLLSEEFRSQIRVLGTEGEQ